MTTTKASLTEPCVMCDKAVEVTQLDSTHEEAPSLWLIQPGAWAGVLAWRDKEPSRIVVCSEACARLLLTEQA